MVARPRERARFDVTDAEFLADLLPAVELVGFDPACDREVMRRRPKVVADRDDVAPDAGEIGERTDHLVVGLTEPRHDARLRRQTGRLGVRENGQAARRSRPTDAPHAASRATVSTLWLSTSGRAANSVSNESEIALRIGDQRLDPSQRPASADRLDALCDERHPTVGEIVAGHHRQHGVVEPHTVDRFGDPRRLTGVRLERLAGVDQAEAARSRAALPQHHERRCAVGPALGEVRAAGVLADGDEVEIADRLLELQHLGPELHLRVAASRVCGSRSTARWSHRPARAGRANEAAGT